MSRGSVTLSNSLTHLLATSSASGFLSSGSSDSKYWSSAGWVADKNRVHAAMRIKGGAGWQSRLILQREAVNIIQWPHLRQLRYKPAVPSQEWSYQIKESAKSCSWTSQLVSTTSIDFTSNIVHHLLSPCTKVVPSDLVTQFH